MDEAMEVAEMATNGTGTSNLLIILLLVLVAVVFVLENIQKLRNLLGFKSRSQLHEEEQAKEIKELKIKMSVIEEEVNELKDYSKEAKQKRMQFEEETTKTLKCIRDDIIKDRVETYRSKILEFSSSLLIKNYTKENFDNILRIADEYHALLEREGMSNSQTDMAMDYIRTKYAQYMQDGFPSYQS